MVEQESHKLLEVGSIPTRPIGTSLLSSKILIPMCCVQLADATLNVVPTNVELKDPGSNPGHIGFRENAGANPVGPNLRQ